MTSEKSKNINLVKDYLSTLDHGRFFVVTDVTNNTSVHYRTVVRILSGLEEMQEIEYYDGLNCYKKL